MPHERLGLIAGNGKFPFLFAQKARSQNYRVIAIGIKGDTSVFLKFSVDEIRYFYPGDLKKAFSYLKEAGVKKAIMAGQVNPERLFDQNIKFDRELERLFAALKDRKADTVFSAFAGKLKEYGIELVDSTFLLRDHMAPEGVLTQRSPSEKESEDIEFGRSIAKTMGDIDIGQTVVVKGKAIVAIEALEGTDQTILRGGRIARQGTVVAKMSKPNQDLRFDVPVIGPQTIRTMIKAGAGCLVIEAGKTIIIDKNRCLRLANQSGISIVSV